MLNQFFRKKLQRFIFGALAIFGCASCLENNDDDSGIPVLVSKTISQDGGSLNSGDDRLSLTIPAGALATSTEIQIKTLTEAEITERYGADSGLDFVYELSPDGLVFLLPIEVELLLPDSADLSIPRTLITVSGGILEEAGNTVFSASTGLLTAQISHFSDLISAPLGLTIEYPKLVNGGPNTLISVDYSASNLFRGEVRSVDNDYSTGSGSEEIIFGFVNSRSLYSFTHDNESQGGDGSITLFCAQSGEDTLRYRLTYYADGGILSLIFGDGRITGTIDLESTIFCAPGDYMGGSGGEGSGDSDFSLAFARVAGTGAEGGGVAGSPNYSYNPTSSAQRYVVASEEQFLVFDIEGNTIGSRTRTTTPIYGVLYLQHSTAGDFLLGYGPFGEELCPVGEGFCAIDSPVSSNNTTDAELGRDANGNRVYNEAFRVRDGSLRHYTETTGGFEETEVFNGTRAQFLPDTIEAVFAYEPLSPSNGLGVTSDGFLYFINTTTDTAQLVSDSAGTEVRDIACDETSDGHFTCAIQSFGDETITPCGGSIAEGFTCGEAIAVGDGISLGVATTDSGNLAVVSTGYTDSTIHLLEITPAFGVAHQSVWTSVQYLPLFSQTDIQLTLLGHADIDPVNDAIFVSANGSGEVALIPLDAFNDSSLTVWFN